jgi:hypothetical protein
MTVILKPFLLGGNMRKRKKDKLVYGVGINDSDTPVSKRSGGKVLWICPAYKAWERILRRCYSDKCHKLQGTYTECIVASEWIKFSNFRRWMMRQKWQGMEVDKDLLKPGNKLYSQDTCVLIQNSINMFLTDHRAGRGDWPIGVSRIKKNGRFRASCSNPFTGKPEYLGSFDCPNIAHEAWRKTKHAHAMAYAAIQEDPRVAAALRIRYLPENIHKIGI